MDERTPDRPARPGRGAPPTGLRVVGRVPSGSNLVAYCEDAAGAGWAYKPVSGERPLHDFPDGTLAAREVATSVVDAALGWNLVPGTFLVAGPGGTGMAERWIDVAGGPEGDAEPAPDVVDVFAPDAVPASHLPFVRAETEDGADVVVAHLATDEMRRIALLDAVVNNADRKAGHVLTGADGRLWAIDHGLAFHTEPKLRTVLWGWAGTPIPDPELGDLRRLRAALDDDAAPVAADLAALLSESEVTALARRIDALLAARAFPAPDLSRYPFPWPLF